MLRAAAIELLDSAEKEIFSFGVLLEGFTGDDCLNAWMRCGCGTWRRGSRSFAL